MNALTLFRPWDEPVAAGAKPIENRPKPPPRKLLGETIAIHAGKHFDSGARRFISERGYVLGGTRGEWVANRRMAIVGVARIAGWLDRRPHKLMRMVDGTVQGMVTALDEHRTRFEYLDLDPWWIGPVGILLVDAVAIEPVACKGAQGWWTVPEAIAALVNDRSGEGGVSCLKGDFLEQALQVQRAAGDATITTVRMLGRELDHHRQLCSPCRAIDDELEAMRRLELKVEKLRRQVSSVTRGVDVVRADLRRKLVTVAEKWGAERGVEVAELLFRMRAMPSLGPDE